ncbi:MAG: hypothetical protein ACI4R9_04315 [Kiritimatiellia bacterium]
MKVKHIAIALALLAGVAIVALVYLGSEKRAAAKDAPAGQADAGAAKRNERRDGKPAAARPEAKDAAAEGAAAKGTAEAPHAVMPDDEWLAQLSDRERALAVQLADAIDNEDLATLKALSGEVRGSENDELRSRMVDALSWFEDKALVELTQYLCDRNPEIAKAAFNAWDSAVEMVDDEKFRVEAATMVMQTLTDEDSLRLAATKLESAGDARGALKAAVDIAADEGNAAAVAVAREVYEFITGEDWPGLALAKVKTITFATEDASEAENPPQENEQ